MIGQIICEYGQTLAVESEQEIYTCFLRKNLESVVVGDFVAFDWDPQTQQGVISKRLPRKSLLARSDRYHPEKEMAANIDQLIVLFSPSPSPNEFYLDQYLVAAEIFNIPAILVLNKTDLFDSMPEEVKVIQSLVSLYEKIGYRIFPISAKTGEGIPALLTELKTKVSFLLGSSGVGKSSLINKLLGENTTRTQAVSSATQKGQHTTSRSTLYHLASGGDIIDVPGIREFKLPASKQVDLIRGFTEFRPFLGQCRFRNCTHHPNEPGCVILERVESGLISQQRLNHYYRMQSA